MISIRHAETKDTQSWLEMRRALWPEDSDGEHQAEIDRFFRGEFPRWPWAVFLAEDTDGRVTGFVEVSVRPYAEGCTTARVAYLEGWYVQAADRRRGVGRALVARAEDWGREQGCTEFASDAEPENHVSHAAHRAVGFADAGLVRCFSKQL